MKWFLLAALVVPGPLVLWLKHHFSRRALFLALIAALVGVGWVFAKVYDYDSTPLELAFAVLMIVFPGLLCATPSMFAPAGTTFDTYFWRYVAGIALGLVTFYSMVAVLAITFGSIG